MFTHKINPPLSNIQIELLRLYATGISDENLKELKVIIAKFLLEKAREKADKIWEDRNYDQNTINNLLNAGD